MKIVTNRSQLMKPVLPGKLTVEQINDNSIILETELERHGGIGLSANQIDMDARMCIINVIDKLVLVNPVIVEVSKETVAYMEQCLSISRSMKTPAKTVRHKTIKINTDNLGIIEFGPTEKEWKDSNEFFGDTGLLECVCVQHEIDHLNGILMTHSTRRYTTTFVGPKKFGRNEKVMVELPDGNTEFMKYKKALPLLQFGCKIL